MPESHRLTEADIDAFVASLMPIVMQSLFNVHRPDAFEKVLQNLVNMRPNVVIPPILEKIYPSIGEDIEPHKFQLAMVSLAVISRPLVLGSRVVNPGALYILHTYDSSIHVSDI